MADHELFALEDMEHGSVRRVEVEDLAVAIVRIGDDVYAIADTCSHAAVSLSEGWVDAEDCSIECAAHGALFDLRDGRALTLPAIEAVAVYSVCVRDSMVVLTLGSEDS